MEDRRFRTDLYYRLNVVPITIPSLRERTEDIPVLAEHFLERFSREIKKPMRGFSDEAISVLLSHQWPGNVRELENAVERAVVIAQSDLVEADDLVLTSSQRGEHEYEGRTLKGAVNLFRKHYILSALERHEWNQTRTARSLGLQRTHLSKLIKELGILKEE